MAKSKKIALVFSDLHLNLWAKFNEEKKRTLDGFRVLSLIAEKSNTLGIPALFCGDLFHKPENMDFDISLYMKRWLDEAYMKWPRCKIFAIQGNHDLKYTNSLNPKDPMDRSKLTNGWIDTLENNIRGNHSTFVVLSPNTPPAIIGNREIMVHGVPYIDHNVGLNEYLKTLHLQKYYQHLLLLHTDYPGAKDTDDRPVDSVENLNLNVLNRFDLVLCGHIHKPQRLSKKVYMVGAPIQQRRTDKDCEMGYWELYSDLSMKFIPLKGFPKFIDVESQDQVKDDGNYYTILPQTSRIEVVSNHKITKQLSKKKLAHRYLRAKGIKDKAKENLLVQILKESEE